MSLLKLLEKYTKEENGGCQCCSSAARRLAERDVGWRFGTDRAWNHWWPVTAQALRKVDSIRDRALALGWSATQLYQNRSRSAFPRSPDFGLVCFLEGDWKIGAVTPDAIEIIEDSRTNPPGCSSFYYPGVGHRCPEGTPPMNPAAQRPLR